jgi:hypothetical protein
MKFLFYGWIPDTAISITKDECQTPGKWRVQFTETITDKCSKPPQETILVRFVQL